MKTLDVSAPLTKRGLILHDGLAFLALTASSVALFGVTLFLFRSFEEHRADLAREWAARGRTALAQQRPADAVAALRTSLSYAPETRPEQFLLAQALADAGRTDEATNYFLNLREATPGDGFINLQLARLARKKDETKEAEDFYRESIFGSWEQDGATRRREVRLEFVDFLLGLRQFSEARNELFTVAQNAPNDATLNLLVAEKLQVAADGSDALAFAEKAVDMDPKNEGALEQAGRIAYQLGEYAKAEDLLQRAVAEDARAPDRGELRGLLGDARRMQELTLTRDQPAGQRANHILLAADVAQARLKSCAAEIGSTLDGAGVVADLNAQWKAATGGGHTKRRTLLENADAQDTWTQLIYRTEQETAQVCGAPSGDDALLLRLAKAGKGEARNGR
jgi:tetratricopeptide (TPR) repeat protein